MVMKVPQNLPLGQILILALCRFSSALANTGSLPYFPMLLAHVGVPSETIAFWLGFSLSMGSVVQFFTAGMWGYISDVVGRKPVILMCQAILMAGALMFGFSTSLAMVLVSRAVVGFSSGDVGILRTSLAEKSLQMLAFSIFPLGLNIGWGFGPLIGGFTANPYHVAPGDHHGKKLLERFPYALPNMIAAVCFVVGMLVIFFGLTESLPSKEGKVDYGVALGKKFTAWICLMWQSLRGKSGMNVKSEDEIAPLLAEAPSQAPSQPADEEEATGGAVIVTSDPVTLRQLLNRQSVLCILLYAILAMHSATYDPLISVLMARPAQHPPSTWPRLPFRFTGGFGSDVKEISLMFTIYGGACMFVPLLITPVLTRYFSVRQVFRTSCTTVILIYIATPFTVLLPRPTNFVVLSILLVLKGFINDFAFSTGSVLIQRSCKLEMGRGRLNGLQVMGTAAARVIGPTWGGSAFVLGTKVDIVGLGFWLAPTTMAILGLVPLAMLEDQ
ncbi:MFS transporter protein [Rutstroemia sp. NJR-2017a BBW]|nr:MFS transporter protein [Rutstroemia sp. NJR-2017a BBW]